MIADVAVVGAGPAGLAAAAELGRLGAGRVVVVERESEPGGVPRHCFHQGYGLRDLHLVMSGPRYARRRAQLAAGAGAELLLSTQVTGWTGDGELELTGPGGRSRLAAGAIILATGCRERPRAARLIAGSRPHGVMNTSTLQQIVHHGRERVGSVAVVAGAEHVSFSALATLAHGGARAAVMTTELPRHQSLAAFRLGAAARYRTRVRTRTAVTAVHGSPRVEAVELTHLDSGAVEKVACDLLVLSADWIPDHELAVLAGADIDPATRGPAVDEWLRTSRPGLFAAGNLLRGAEPADAAALEGVRAARAARAHLSGEPWPAGAAAIRCAEPLQWMVPGRVSGGAGARRVLRSREHLLDVRLRLLQGARLLAEPRLARVMPGRSVSVGAAWEALVDPAGGEVEVSVLSARRRG